MSSCGGKNGCWEGTGIVGGGDGCCCEKNDGGGGGDGGGERLLLLLLFSNSCLSFNLFNLSLITKSVPGGRGALFISSLATSFFQRQVLLVKNQQLDFQSQTLKYLQKQVQLSFVSLEYFY